VIWVRRQGKNSEKQKYFCKGELDKHEDGLSGDLPVRARMLSSYLSCLALG
jgi:hypothetical protein